MSASHRLVQAHLESYHESRAQDPAFLWAQERMRERHSRDWDDYLLQIGQLAHEAGQSGFTADDVLDRTGREGRHPNLIGCVLGSLRASRRLRTIGRVKGRSPAGHARWVNVFALPEVGQ